MPVDERTVVDLCRTVTDSTEGVKFGRFHYDIIRNCILSDDNMEVATVTLSGPLAEENGYLLASSATLRDYVARSEYIVDYVSKNSKCASEGHDELRCVRCRALKAHQEAVELLSVT
jgi:hypothetical protein